MSVLLFVLVLVFVAASYLKMGTNKPETKTTSTQMSEIALSSSHEIIRGNNNWNTLKTNYFEISFPSNFESGVKLNPSTSYEPEFLYVELKKEGSSDEALGIKVHPSNTGSTEEILIGRINQITKEMSRGVWQNTSRLGPQIIQQPHIVDLGSSQGAYKMIATNDWGRPTIYYDLLNTINKDLRVTINVYTQKKEISLDQLRIIDSILSTFKPLGEYKKAGTYLGR